MRLSIFVSTCLVFLFACGDDDGPSDGSTADAVTEDAVAEDTIADDATVDAPGQCADNSECEATEICDATACDGPGECVARPINCSLVEDLVCGCDGDTYTNACIAHQAGVRVAATGECACTENTDCEATEYCMKSACGDAGGECIERPSGCDDVGTGACGCDGVTYVNECSLGAAGANLASLGECPCMENADCEASEYCQKAMCGDAAGECVPRRSGCDDVGTGACGCDGMDYVNECTLSAAGVNLASLGTCPCASNDECRDGLYCQKENCDDAEGTCVGRPVMCDDVGLGVCSCTMMTYVNECSAHRAGENIASTGACL